MRRFVLERTLYGRRIFAEVTVLDDGLHILLAGGERTHVGATALAQGGALLACPAYPGHKEQTVCERWAQELSCHTGGCVTVCGGIHYDNATKEQIAEILHVCGELLREGENRLAQGVCAGNAQVCNAVQNTMDAGGSKITAASTVV